MQALDTNLFSTSVVQHVPSGHTLSICNALSAQHCYTSKCCCYSNCIVKLLVIHSIHIAVEGVS